MTAPFAPPVVDRIAHIVGMMRELQWVRGKSAIGLAEQWGIAVSTVEGHSAEARRIVYAETVDPQMVTIKACALLEQVMDDAMAESRNPNSSDPNKARAIVINATKQWSEITGAKAPTRTESVNVDAVVATPAEAKRVMRELFGGVTPGDGPHDDNGSDSGEPEEGSPAD